MSPYLLFNYWSYLIKIEFVGKWTTIPANLYHSFSKKIIKSNTIKLV